MDSSIGDGKPITANVVGKPKNTMNVLNALQATLESANALNQSLKGLSDAITSENAAQKAKPSASVAHATAATSPKAKRKARNRKTAKQSTAKQSTKQTAKQSVKDFVFPSALYVTAKQWEQASNKFRIGKYLATLWHMPSPKHAIAVLVAGGYKDMPAWENATDQAELEALVADATNADTQLYLR